MARAIRSGETLRAAVAAVPADPTVADATSAFRSRLEHGSGVAESADDLDRWDDEPHRDQWGDEPHLAMAMSVIAATSRLGELGAGPFDRVAAVLRLRDADRQERAVHSAQAALSARVLTALPIAMLLLLVVTDGDVRTALAQPLGMTILAAGASFNAIGWLWMRWIVRVPS